MADPVETEVVPARHCDACGAAMTAGQDWCLECGTAAPGRLGQRPGMRTAAAVAAATLALVGGAVAASYAALDEDARLEASQPAPPDGTPLAQVPPQLTQTGPNPEVAPPAVTAPPATTPTVPPLTTPKVPAPPRTPPVTPPAAPPAIPPSGGSTSGGSGPSGDRTPTRPTTTPTTTTPAAPTLTAVEPGADFAQLYDPYENALDPGDPADVHDGDSGTSWRVSTSPDRPEMGVGLVLDLEKPRGVKVLELATKTRGFRVEVYAADTELPPDILDTRWAHLVDRSDVDERGGRDKNVAKDGRERIVLGGGSRKYRYVCLWLTVPPDAGPTVRLSEVKVLQ